MRGSSVCASRVVLQVCIGLNKTNSFNIINLRTWDSKDDNNDNYITNKINVNNIYNNNNSNNNNTNTNTNNNCNYYTSNILIMI